jgi:predicted outer membrane protein
MKIGAFVCTLAAAIGNLTDASPDTRSKAARALRESGARADAAEPALARSPGADSSINV